MAFFFCSPLVKPYYVPGKVNKMTLILNHSDFKVTLDGISAHDAGTAFRIELACFFGAENQVLPFRGSFVGRRRFLKTQNALVGRPKHSAVHF